MGWRQALTGTTAGWVVGVVALSLHACGARTLPGADEDAGSGGRGASSGAGGIAGGSSGRGGRGGAAHGGKGGAATGGAGGNANECRPGTFATPEQRQCTPWSICQPGSFVSAEGTATSDRRCAPCPDGQTSAQLNAPRCHILPVDLAARDEHTCALFSDGSVKCWGVNRRGGILGYGNTVDHVSDPASVGFVSISATPGVKVVQLGVGSATTCPLLSDGSLKCWGDGQYGQLGYGNNANIGDDELPSSAPPISLTSDARVSVKSVAGGLIHTCALLSDNSLKCWGSGCCNGYGRPIGDNEVPASVAPLRISNTAAVLVLSIAANGLKTCLLLATGAVKCWGRNDSGQLGYGNTTDVANPASAGTVSISATPGPGVKQLVAGYEHVCVLLGDDSVKCWGSAEYGQLGYGNTRNIGDNELPSSVGAVGVSDSARVKTLAAGAHHTCALLDNGHVKCWGLNNFGQLGHGNTVNVGDDEVPAMSPDVSVTNVPGVVVKKLALGDYHSCALLSDNSIQCWGENSLGQLGHGNTVRIGDDELPSSRGPVVLF